MRDGHERVTGSVAFTGDLTLPGMLHAAVSRSRSPHARLLGIDISAALRVEGVTTVITARTLDERNIEPTYPEIRRDRPLLAGTKVRYIGEPVAVVVARSAEIARRASELVEVEYEELPYVLDPVAAGEPGAVRIHAEHEGNACGSWRLRHGDVEAAWAECDRVYEATYTSPSASHVPLEPHVGVAAWQDGRLTVWTSTQAPYRVRQSLATVFRIPPADVRVLVPNVGGGFGAKGYLQVEPLVAAASLVAGAPVRLELRRDEVFYTVAKHAATIQLKTGVSLDGAIRARKVSIVWNAGAYALSTPRASGQGMVRSPGPYAIPNVWIDSCARYTNTVPTGPFRGSMTSQVCWAYESQMDEIARDLGIDPIDLRRRNMLTDGGTYATGEVMHDMHYGEILDDLERFITLRRTRDHRDDRARGFGVAIMIKSTATPSRSEAMIRLRAGGGPVELLSSSVEMGQGAHSSLLRLAAEELGVSTERLSYPTPDTDAAPYDSSTSSSRTTFSMGAATVAAARDLTRRLTDLVCSLRGVAPESVRHRNGEVLIGQSEAIPWEKILQEAGLEVLVGSGRFASEGGLATLDDNAQGKASIHWHQGGVAAEVAVDRETGRIEVVALHGVTYAGRVVSPARVRAQIEGCLIYGLGPAMFEELNYDNGQLVNPNLSDYLIPSIIDTPITLSSTAVRSHDEGADIHGVGEMTVPPVAPAIGNALRDAVGVAVTALPLTPERVLRALTESAGPDGGTR